MALIQKTSKLTTEGADLPQTFSDAFPAMPRAGSDVIFALVMWGAAPTSVTICGTTAILDGESPIYEWAPNVRAHIYRARIGASRNRDIVIAGSGQAWMTAGAIEVDPLDDDPVDAYATAVSWVNAGAFSIETADPTVQDDELVVALWTQVDAATDLNATVATPGYTELFQENNHRDRQGGHADFKFVSASGVQVANWTKESDGYVVRGIITYKLRSDGPSEPSAEMFHLF